MGMFDTIICKYPLPMPSDPKGYVGSESFQTKDLENALLVYEIREDGTLWEQKHETEWVEGDSKSDNWLDKMGHNKTLKSWWDQVSFTKTIRMLDVQFNDGEYDYVINYKINFVKGVVSEVEISSFEARPNNERKSRDFEFIEIMKQREKFIKSWKYRYFYKHYHNVVHFVLGTLVVLFSWLAATLSKLERRISI